MRHGYFNKHEITGFDFGDSWRLHYRPQDSEMTISCFYLQGKFFQANVDLPPNPKDELSISKLTSLNPTPEAEQAVLAALLEWRSSVSAPKLA